MRYRYLQAAARKTLQQLTVMDGNKSGGRVRRRFENLEPADSNADPPGSATAAIKNYEDLYLTEHPYGLVCGVETDLPAND